MRKIPLADVFHQTEATTAVGWPSYHPFVLQRRQSQRALAVAVLTPC